MNSLNKAATFGLLILTMIGTSAPTVAQVGSRIAPRYVGNGKWVLIIRTADGNKKRINSSTPGIHGFRISVPASSSSIFIVEEDFEDGTRYGVYLDTKSGFKKKYEMDDMLAVWKELPSQHGRRSLLFVNNMSDYDTLQNVAADPNLFTTISWVDSPREIVKSSCGFRNTNRALNRFTAKSTSGAVLMGAVESLSDLSCQSAH